MRNVLFAGLVALSGLWSGCDAVNNAVDCHSICGRYRDCYDDGYDTGGCESRCRDKANSDRGYMEDAANCSACLDAHKSCVSATFLCGVECTGLVP